MSETTPAVQRARDAFSRDSNRIFKRVQRRSKITALQREEIVRRYGEGEDAKDLALEFGISAGYIRGHLSARR